MNFTISNRFLQILHKSERINRLDKEKKKEIIDKIMTDIDDMGLFDIPTEKEEDMFINAEYESDILFREKRQCLNERVKQKQVELGLYSGDNEKEVEKHSSYGRTPLHEAVALRDIESIRKYVIKGKYLTEKDNNGNTAYAMAFYGRYTEVINLFNELRRIL